MKSYRGKLEIIADVLRAAKRNAKKTHIMYQANLSYKVLQRYLKYVTSASLVNFETGEQCYVLTPKGLKFLEAYKNYAKNNKKIKAQLNDVNNVKQTLEKLCSTE